MWKMIRSGGLYSLKSRNTKILATRANFNLLSRRQQFSTEETGGNKLAINEPKVTKNPWTEVKDKNGSGLVYYWNKETNETTALGASRPKHWIEVPDREGSNLTYWWCPDTNETTPLGAPKPGSVSSSLTVANIQQPPAAYQQQRQYPPMQPVSLGTSMKYYFGWGVGMTLAFIMIRGIIG